MKPIKFYVTFKVDARFTAEVEADDLETARKIAEKQFSETDFGEAEDIDGDIVTIEDEAGGYLYEK